MKARNVAVLGHSAVAFAVAMLVWLAAPADARTLRVGPHQVLKLPSEAAAMARDGDRVLIDPGTYADCAVWRASRLTIEAAAPGVVVTGSICQEKGIFITVGRDITVRGLTFSGAHGQYHNAAGIRAAGDNLTVLDSRFLDNENGILAGGSSVSILRVIGSEFHGNGSCEGACAHGIYAGQPFALLDVERCRFSATHVGHHVKSRARSTILVGSRIEDGPDGTASYLIDIPNGGDVRIEDNDLEKGPHSENHEVAISIGEEGVSNPTRSMVVRHNRLRNDLPQPTTFVRNGTPVAAELVGNVLLGPVTPLVGPGVVRP